MHPKYPIATLISSYKEGSLIQGAIRSVQCLDNPIFVGDGRHSKDELLGDDTDITELLGSKNLFIVSGEKWDSETEKRNWHLNWVRNWFDERRIKSFWILTLDADEILVWGEYLQDWLNALNPYADGNYTQECIVPLKRTEAEWNKKAGRFVTDTAPSRCIHSSVIDRYLVGTLRFATPDNKEVSLHHYPSKNPVMYGEPHIHHRHYLRRFGREMVRASNQEEKEWRDRQVTSQIAAYDENGNPIQVEIVE